MSGAQARRSSRLLGQDSHTGGRLRHWHPSPYTLRLLPVGALTGEGENIRARGALPRDRKERVEAKRTFWLNETHSPCQTSSGVSLSPCLPGADGLQTAGVSWGGSGPGQPAVGTDRGCRP